MDHANQRTLTAGRAAVRWFIFLVFFHLLPVPWFMVVAAGLAPASFLFAIGVAGLFVTDFDSLPMAVMFLAPALISGLIFVLLAYLLTAGIRLLKKPVAITFSLIIILVVCLGIALNPVYISGGHGSGHQFSMLDFLDILGQFRVPPAVSLSYFICLALLLAGLLVYQHTPQSFPTLPLSREQRRRLLRRSMLGGLILFIALICWTHRALFFLKPLADMGVGEAQYRLALALHKNPASKLASNTDSRYYLERAAEQGHIDAAMALARLPRSADEKLRWLTVAAEGGQAEAQYQLYLFMMKSSMVDYKFRNALDWLQSAAESGFADAQYELGRNLIQGNRQLGIERNSKNARQWWEKAADNGHGRAMEELAGGSFYPIADLQRQATAGDLQAQYQLGRQLLVTASADERQKGLQWMERAAEGGYAEAQYRLATYYENEIHIMRDNPSRGIDLLRSAAEQNHLPAMGALALAYEQGRYGLTQDYQQAQYWYRKLLQAYESGLYLGDVDDRFILFQRRYLEYVNKARQYQEDRSRRYEQATALERQIMEIEDRYRLKFQKAVNGLNHQDGSREGKKRFRAQVERLRQEYAHQREVEIEKIKRKAADGR
jgi:TPR repeat protein